MNAAPPFPGEQRKPDADHLNLLAIFHFVGAGLALFGILFLLLHFAIMHAVFANPKIWADQKNGPPPAEFFAIFQWLYLFAGVWLFTSLSLNVLSGLFLRARKHRTFSFAVAGLNCLHMPFGTVLGVFTIIVLNRDSVRELYET